MLKKLNPVEWLSTLSQRGADRGPCLVRPYMPELDSARGLAILLVLLYHGLAPPANAQHSSFSRLLLHVSQLGWTGVNLFFVLSGFLITGILLDSRARVDYFRRFYIRRALRILPALYATLFVLLVGGWISWRFLMLSVFFLANSAPLLGVPLQYGPLWSLAVEEHFYMLWPAAIRKLSGRTLVLLAIVILVATPLVRGFGFVLNGSPADFATLYTWFNLDGLALGALLAMGLRWSSSDRKQLWGISTSLLAVGTSAFMLVLSRPFLSAAFAATACNLGFMGLLLGMLLTGTSRWSFLVDRPLLKFLGFISYGLYLVHVLAFRLAEILLARPLLGLASANQTAGAMLLRFCAGSTLAIVLAYWSRRSLEERFLRIGFSSRMFQPKQPESQLLDARAVLGS
jgi:peptidoglycan/LPS O-acetylase OafA/YrhL